MLSAAVIAFLLDGEMSIAAFGRSRTLTIQAMRANLNLFAIFLSFLSFCDRTFAKEAARDGGEADD
jgi:hypothetical protein